MSKSSAALKADARIIDLPNGTRADEVDQAALSAANNPRQRSGAQAIKIRVLAGAHKGFEAWTLPDLVDHEWPPIISVAHAEAVDDE